MENTEKSLYLFQTIKNIKVLSMITLPKNPFGGVDEQKAQEMFEDLCGGVKKAERLLHLWNDSYPCGTKYDKTFKTGFYRSKEQIFWIKAKRDGFTQEQIDMFMGL